MGKIPSKSIKQVVETLQILNEKRTWRYSSAPGTAQKHYEKGGGEYDHRYLNEHCAVVNEPETGLLPSKLHKVLGTAGQH